MSNSLLLCRGTLFLLISLLAACGGDLLTADGDTVASDGDGSTPQLSDRPSSDNNGGERPAMSEAAAAGKADYEDMNQGCAGCHGVDGKADTFKAIDLEAERYEHSSVAGADYSLEEYLTNWMPVSDPSICIGDCATNIAAYLRYLGGSQPAVDDPVTDNPVTDDPATNNPVVDEPVTDDPATDNPVVDENESIARGMALYDSREQGCASCHGADGQANIFKAIDLEAETYQHSSVAGTDYSLEDYLVQWMPISDPSICAGDCATDIAAYLRSLAMPQPPVDDPVVDEPVVDEPVVDEPPRNNLPLARNGWMLSASSNSGDLGNATDGSAQTRWTTEAFQKSGQSFEIDLQTPTTFNRIALDSEESSQDFPRGYEVFVSADGVNWGQSIRSGAGQEGTTVIDVNTVTARHVRITQTGSSTNRWWSIHEVNLFLKGDSGPIVAPPVDEPPVEEPPVDEPPVDEPPVDEPPVDEPPVDEPPVDEPPVPNVNPSVSFNQPSSGAEIAFGSDINVRVSASDSDGSVVNVTLYLNNAFIGQDTSSPYEWSSSNDAGLNNVAAGTYTLTAVALDDDGATTINDLLMTINPAPPELDGVALYGEHCAACHKALDITNKPGSSVAQINRAIEIIPPMALLASLSDEQIAAIAGALAPEEEPEPEPEPETGPQSSDFFPSTNNYQAIDRRAFRLTKPQIINSMNQILEVNIPNDALGSDPKEGSFANSSDRLSIPNDLLEDIMDLVESNYSVDSDDQLRAFMSCPSNASLSCSANNCSSCVDDYITSLSSQAYRKPITSDERNELRALYATLSNQHSAVDAMSYFLQTVLTNPRFLFKLEEGELENNQYRLTANEKLEAVSLTLTNRPPSEADILNAAGIIGNTGNFKNYVNGLLASDEGHAVLEQFLKQWIGVDATSIPEKDPFPGFTEAVKSAMIQEIDEFVAYTVDQEKVTLETLLTSNYSFLQPVLADFYGEANSGATNVSDFRQGILLKGGYAAINSGSSTTNPTKRGSHIVDQLLCYELPGFPENINIITEDPDPSVVLTTRQKFEAHSVSPECRSCHEVMDPLGFGLENYGVDGSFRLFENDVEVDASDEFSVLPYTNLQFSGPVEMVEQIAAAPETKACLVRQVFRFTHGRTERAEDDEILAKAMDSYTASGFDIRAVFESFLTNSDSDTRD